MQNSVLNLDNKLTLDKSLVGSKALNLLRLKQLNVNIPKTILITKNYFEHFMEYNRIVDPLEDPNLILMGEFSEGLKKELFESLEKVGFNQQSVLVCRSSSIEEDGDRLSYAGQFESIIGITGFENLLLAIKICWFNGFNNINVKTYSSFFNSSSAFLIPLVVQEMVNSKVSGVAFLGKDSNEITIESSWGMGTTVVNNYVNPDRVVLGEQLLSKTNIKGTGFFFCNNLDQFELGDLTYLEQWDTSQPLKLLSKDPFGNIGYFQLPSPIREQNSLSENEFSLLKNAFKEILRQYQNRDVEWSIDFEGNLYILQIRPITVQYNSQQHESKNNTDIIGMSASPGIAYGKVKVIQSNDDFYKVEQGDIIVCRRTTPEYLPVMVKAAGIISEEGGILSHTAIVSRELGKPCVTECSYATLKLQDYDEIVVNAYKGTIQYSYNETEIVTKGENNELLLVNENVIKKSNHYIVDPFLLWKNYLNTTTKFSVTEFKSYIEDVIDKYNEHYDSLTLDLSYPSIGATEDILSVFKESTEILSRFEKIHS